MPATPRKRSRSAAAANVQHSSNWSTTSTRSAPPPPTAASISAQLVRRSRCPRWRCCAVPAGATSLRLLARAPSWRCARPRRAATAPDRRPRPSSCPIRTGRRPPRIAGRRAHRGSRAATSSRPKKSSASASANGRRPLYGLTDDEISAVRADASRRRSDDVNEPAAGSTGVRTPSARPTAARHATISSAIDSKRRRRVGLGRPRDHRVDRRARRADAIHQARQARALRGAGRRAAPTACSRSCGCPTARCRRRDARLGHVVAAPARVVIDARRPGDAEVGQVRVARRVEQDVRRLDVAVDHAGRVCRQQRRARPPRRGGSPAPTSNAPPLTSAACAVPPVSRRKTR